MPRSCRATTRSRIQIHDVWPMLDCGRYPVKRTLGDRVDVWADVFARRARVAPGRRPATAAGHARWREAPLEPLGNDRWHGAFEATALGRWQSTSTAWVDRCGVVAEGARAQARGRPGGPRPASCSRARVLARGRGADRRRGARPGDGADAGRSTRRRRSAPLELDRRPRAGALRRAGTSSSRAPGAASRASRSSSRGSPSSASTSSTSRRSTRSASPTARGATTRPRRRPATRAARGRSAARRAGTPPCTRSSARSRTSSGWSRARGELGIESRSTSRSSARPTTPGSTSTRSGSTAGPTAR